MTRRVQFQRSSVTGATPDRLQAGTPAFNWPDQKIHVGGVGDTPAFSLQKIDDFSSDLVYRAKDLCVYENGIWRANVDIPAGVGWRAEEWTSLAGGASGSASQTVVTGTFEGGASSLVDARTVQVAAGSGIVVDRSVPGSEFITLVEWGDFTAAWGGGTVGSYGSAVVYLRIGADGGVSWGSLSRTTIRSHIHLARLGVSTSTGDFERITDTRTYAGRALDAAYDHQMFTAHNTAHGGLWTSAAGGLTLAVEGGYIMGRDHKESQPTDIKSITGSSPALMTVGYATEFAYGSDTTNVPVDIWDNAGVLEALPSGKVAGHRLYVDRDGLFSLSVGQKVYDNLSEAKAQMPIDVGTSATNGGLFDIYNGQLNEISTIFVMSGATDLTDPEQCAIVETVRGNERYKPVGDQDLGNYYRLDASSPLTANLAMGGNALSNGDVNGDYVNILPTNVPTTGGVPTGPLSGELTLSNTDSKVFSGSQLIASHTRVWDAARVYLPDDTAFRDDVLQVCLAETTAGVWDPADWQAIGASVDLSDAVALAPGSDTRNTIDLSTAGDWVGLQVTPNASQTKDLARFGDAVIDRYGMARGAFGSTVIRVSQATHALGPVGSPVAFDNPNWVSADASNVGVEGKALGVVHSVVSANEVNIQLSGAVSNLDVGAFEGGSIIAGTAYYVSSSTAGKLTATAPALPNRVDPVLLATSASEAVLVVGSIGGSSSTAGQGNTVFEVAQTAHGFVSADIGRPIYYNGTLWSEALASNLATVGIAMVDSVTDANNFVVNVSGFIDSISSNAFLDNVAPTAGTFYYVSQTNAGNLTETPPLQGENRNLIFFALSTTAGIVLGYEPEAATIGATGEQYAEGMIYSQNGWGWGSGSGQQHRLTDNDGTSHAAIRFSNKYDAGVATNIAATSAGTGGVSIEVDHPADGGVMEVNLYSYDTVTDDGSLITLAKSTFDHKLADDLPSGTSVVTRMRADSRFPQLSEDNTLTGVLTLQSGAVGSLELIGRPADGYAQIEHRTEDGELVGQLRGVPALAANTNGEWRFYTENGIATGASEMSLCVAGPGAEEWSDFPSLTAMTRGKTDGRYGQLGKSNTWTGVQTFGSMTVTGTLTGEQGGLFNGPVTITTATTPQLSFADGTHGASVALSDDVVLEYKIDDTLAGVLPPAAAGVASGETLMTATRGDGRYGQKAAGNTWAQLNTFANGAISLSQSGSTVSFICSSDDGRPIIQRANGQDYHFRDVDVDDDDDGATVMSRGKADRRYLQKEDQKYYRDLNSVYSHGATTTIPLPVVWGGVPVEGLRMTMVCNIAEGDWLPGDEITLPNFEALNASFYNFTVTANDTEVRVSCGNGGAYVHDAAGLGTVLTPANWRIGIRAWIHAR